LSSNRTVGPYKEFLSSSAITKKSATAMSPIVWEGRTDPGGGVAFATPRGCYDILVSATFEFLPFAQRYCMVSSENSSVRVKLKADPHPLLLLQH
jgi:hypothetical protein